MWETEEDCQTSECIIENNVEVWLWRDGGKTCLLCLAYWQCSQLNLEKDKNVTSCFKIESEGCPRRQCQSHTLSEEVAQASDDAAGRVSKKYKPSTA